MRTAPLAAALVAALLAPAGLANDMIQGEVLVGTGAPLLPGTDHRRHAIPDGAVGIDLPDAVVQAGSAARYGVVVETWFPSCDLDQPCPMVVYIAECLAVYADAGAVRVPYSFAWAFDEDAADLRLWELPSWPETPAGASVHPDCPDRSDGEE